MVASGKRPDVITAEGLKYLGKKIYERVKQKKKILYLLAKGKEIDMDNDSCNIAIKSTLKYSEETVIDFIGPKGERLGDACYRGNKWEYQIFRFTPGRDITYLLRSEKPIYAVLENQDYHTTMEGHHSVISHRAGQKDPNAKYRKPTHKKRHVVRQHKKGAQKELSTIR